MYKATNLVEMFINSAKEFENFPVQTYRLAPEKWHTLTYSELYSIVKRVASSLNRIGVNKGIKVVLYSDNRYEWLVLDLAILFNGAIDVPRGKMAPKDELSFIAEHSGAKYAIIENKSLLSTVSNIPRERTIIIEKTDGYVSFDELVSSGDENFSPPKIRPEDLATIIYTSGTTGNPKGVMLTHRNFMHNVSSITPLIKINPNRKGGERALSILPTWHSFERTFEYCCLAGGAEICYTDIRHFANDLKERSPTIMSAVPRVWISIYNNIIDEVKKFSVAKRLLFRSALFLRGKYLYAYRVLTGNDTLIKPLPKWKRSLQYIVNLFVFILFSIPGILAYIIFKPVREAVGGRLRGAFTGGGTLPHFIDDFFNTVGITLLNAYGMTECSPGISARRFERNHLYTVGLPFDLTEIKICDENGNTLPPGNKGTIYIRGPQVMLGYYKNERATKDVLSPDGWLNTGDLGIITTTGDLIIVGRAKDTIVLTGGENIEPNPIEETLEQSEYITHAVLVGNDMKSLGALLVLEESKIKQLFTEWKTEFYSLEKAITNINLNKFIKDQIRKLINESQKFHPFEKIKQFSLLPNQFNIGEELTQTLKKKRAYIAKKYSEYIKRMFGKH